MVVEIICICAALSFASDAAADKVSGGDVKVKSSTGPTGRTCPATTNPEVRTSWLATSTTTPLSGAIQYVLVALNRYPNGTGSGSVDNTADSFLSWSIDRPSDGVIVLSVALEIEAGRPLSSAGSVMRVDGTDALKTCVFMPPRVASPAYTSGVVAWMSETQPV